MIQVYKTTEELSKAAADLFVQAAQEAVQANGRFTVALTGGSSPEQLYRMLAQPPYRDLVPWQQTFVFWGDERWVNLEDDRSNAKMAFTTLLHHVPVPQEQVFPMWGEGEPEEFAIDYEKKLQSHFANMPAQFDLVLLGMGDDGHTASLFPGTPVLKERERWVQAYYLEPQSMYRITLTAPCLNQARKIVFMTYGEKKAKALQEVLQGEHNPETYPAQLIQPQQGETVWLVDEAATSLLTAQP
ncbi:6-phosphogluconolactonase [Rufibacter glacialis]|uniref:6-phosphogluconolactonase n=1 Tax=Rufibacter glacialis TaxID=1259555 RepID=A0A5M8QFP6_9BACT|nr:6-phosphogluconolactonase [Rufibacter glacialis]KAA6434819.1 6-phosphogluconolactonase [Rufibacter glacialis]GGK72699.1 6-phosphogluconolactonase [Rufibacter glacialis]